MPMYTITQLRDVRAWRKVEMEFADDDAAAAHVEELAKAVREGGEVPESHPLTDADHSTDYDVHGRESFFLDGEDEDGDENEICGPLAYTPNEIAAEKGADLLAALRAILPYAESRAEDVLEAAEESEKERRECAALDRKLADKAVAAVDAAKALLASLDAA